MSFLACFFRRSPTQSTSKAASTSAITPVPTNALVTEVSPTPPTSSPPLRPTTSLPRLAPAPESPPMKPDSPLKKFLTALGGLTATLILVVTFLIGPLPGNNQVASFEEIEQQFRYGSIGGESGNGIPYWIWQVLPEMFPDYLPGKGYTSLGFIQEPGQEVPIGFAKSQQNGLAVVTQNCATCHVGRVRTDATEAPAIISTMPANTVDLGRYIQFLRQVAADPRFTAREMMPYIAASGAELNPLEKLLYRFVAIPQTRDALLMQRDRLAFVERQAPYGPGRVDTFTPYKTLRFNFPQAKLTSEELNGVADFSPIWAQKKRVGMQLHWDGNNDSIDERNKSAALALVQPTTINFPAIHRLRDWLLEVPHPAYPFPVDAELVARGETLYEANCATCHAFDGDKTGTVEPLAAIATDRGRLDSYTMELAANQYSLFTDISDEGEDQRFSHFRKTDGYSNLPLDGVWLRAPYLHNGSVPTLRDLLKRPAQRPRTFYRGNDLYDPDNMGFVSNVAADENRSYFRYDTQVPGNGNGGHTYGTTLPAADKTALIEYLKTL